MKTIHKFQTRSGRNLAPWVLIAVLVLLLTVGAAGAWEQGGVGAWEQGGAGAWEQGGVGAEEQGGVGAEEHGSAGEGEQGFEHVNVSLADLPLANKPHANMPLADLQTSTTRTVTFSYDRSGRLTSANYGDGALLVYSYDPAGNLLRRTDHFDIHLPLVIR